MEQEEEEEEQDQGIEPGQEEQQQQLQGEGDAAEQQEQEQELEEGGPEGQEVRAVRAYDRPCQDEVDAHYVSHVPYRPWCEHCVAGKADAGAHHRRQGHREIPEVSIDYMFLTGRGDEEQDETGLPTIVWRDSDTKLIKARVVSSG